VDRREDQCFRQRRFLDRNIDQEIGLVQVADALRRLIKTGELSSIEPLSPTRMPALILN
jgi:hypothetical protein